MLASNAQPGTVTLVPTTSQHGQFFAAKPLKLYPGLWYPVYCHLLLLPDCVGSYQAESTWSTPCRHNSK